MDTERAVLLANGELPDSNWLQSFLHSSDCLIAVDGGLNHLDRLGITPHLLIGDLDSVTPDQVERCRAAGVEIRRYPPAKDETDLELALLAAHDLGYRAIIVVAALGGRLDQTLGNLSLLQRPELADAAVRCDDGRDEVFILHNQSEIHGQNGDTVSLLPLWGVVTGVTTANLAYPLNHETLYPDHTRGISNRMTAPVATVSLTAGELLCIHTRKSKTEEK